MSCIYFLLDNNVSNNGKFQHKNETNIWKKVSALINSLNKQVDIWILKKKFMVKNTLKCFVLKKECKIFKK